MDDLFLVKSMALLIEMLENEKIHIIDDVFKILFEYIVRHYTSR